jgi:hypothetical protein
VTEFYIADGGEPLWVTAIWIASKFLVVWLALRLTPLRAFLATVAMVIASTIVLIGCEIILTSLALLPLLVLLVLRVVVETAIEAAVLVWAFRIAGSGRLTFLLGANVVALVLSVFTATMSDIDRASNSYVVPVGAKLLPLMDRSPGSPLTVVTIGLDEIDEVPTP